MGAVEAELARKLFELILEAPKNKAAQIQAQQQMQAMLAARDRNMMTAGFIEGFVTCLGIVLLILIAIGIFKLATRRSKAS